MKMLLIISDGIGDVPCKDFGYKTPLEHGNYPALAKLAKEGITGMMDPLAPNFPAGSDTAHIAILGEDPFETYNGRGFLEALGTGLRPRAADIGFRVNFGTVENGVVVDRRAGRSPLGLATLATDICSEIVLDVPFQFREASGTRAALVLSGDNLSANVSDGDPHALGAAPHEICPLDDTPEAKFTAEQLNKFIEQARELLSDHPVNRDRQAKDLLPANFLLVRGAGQAPDVATFQERYGVSCACIASTALIQGVSLAFGFDLIDVEGATGETNTDEVAKANATVEALRDYDFVFTHFKATDTASHDGDPKKKVAMIQKLDNMVSHIMAGIDKKDVVIALTGDHTTPCDIGDHTGEPVPVIVWGKNVRADNVTSFGERSCAQGGLGRINGQDLVPILLNQTRRIKKYGA